MPKLNPDINKLMITNILNSLVIPEFDVLLILVVIGR